MRRLLLFVVFVLLFAPTTSAQTATVVRNVNLRPDASSNEDPIRLLKPRASLTLVKRDPLDGYYKVRTEDGEVGWVYARNIRLDAPEDADEGVAPAAAATLTLPPCDDEGVDHQREGMKKRDKSDATTKRLTVGQMLNWRVPTDLDSSARTSDEPIATLEERGDVYELTGWIRLVKYQADCDFHVEVASARQPHAPMVIVEIPRKYPEAQRALMRIAGIKSGGKSKNLEHPKDPVRATFTGFAFLDQTHQTKKPTQAGHGHGSAGVKTLWELHPVWAVR